MLSGRRIDSLHARYRWLILVLALISLPVVGYGAKQAWDSIANRVEDWLPDSFDETRRLIWFYERFGTDELVMISWRGCTLTDARLPVFAQKLAATTHVDGQPTQWFRLVTTGRSALDALTEPPLELSTRQALDRLTGSLISTDQKQTCAVAIVSSAGESNRHAAIEYIYQCADEVPGLSRDKIYVAGTTRDGVAIDKASKKSLASLNLGSFLVCILIMFICYRSAGLTAMVFTTALFCEQLSMAIMHFSGQPMDSVLTLASNLTYVLAISAGVHLVNYYREAQLNLRQGNAVAWAFRAALRPSLLSAGTTAIGMMSLTVSQIRPVTNFGFYAAISVVAGTLVVLTLIPAELYQWPLVPSSWVPRQTEERDRMAVVWDYLSSLTYRLRWLILAAAMTTIGFVLSGVSKIETSVQLHDLFAPDAEIIRDYAWLEKHVGPLIPIEVVIEIPKSIPLQVDDRMRIVADTQQAVDDTRGVGATTSAATFAPLMPSGQGLRAVARRSLIRSQLRNALPEFVEMKYLHDDGAAQLWRISARVAAGGRLDYGEVMREIRQNVETQLADHPSVAAVYCGSVPLIYKAQREMLNDLIKSFGLAFILISLMMVVLLRSPVAGLLTMIPNVLPSLFVFGMMGWLGVSVELGSMLTASAALGIAVDDSLHFIAWYRGGIAQGMTRREAARLAYRHCGLAMIQTSMICCFGLLVFALSPFTPIARFAWLMFTLLQLALLCDLVVLPAVLMCFSGRDKSSDRTNRPGETALQ